MDIIENLVCSSVLSNVVFLAGFFFIATSIIGVTRFKHLYNKIHAASALESLGIPFFIISLILISRESYYLFDLAKLFGCIFLIYLCSALNTSCVALIKKSEDINLQKNDLLKRTITEK